METPATYLDTEIERVNVSDLKVGDVILSYGVDEFVVTGFDELGRPVTVDAWAKLTRRVFLTEWPNGTAKTFKRVIEPRSQRKVGA